MRPEVLASLFPLDATHFSQFGCQIRCLFPETSTESFRVSKLLALAFIIPAANDGSNQIGRARVSIAFVTRRHDYFVWAMRPIEQ